MKLPKSYLREILDTGDYVSNRITGSSRWSTHHEMIFIFDDKFFRSVYSQGATEMKDEAPYEYQPDQIECEEVRQVEKLVKVWEKV